MVSMWTVLTLLGIASSLFPLYWYLSSNHRCTRFFLKHTALPLDKGVSEQDKQRGITGEVFAQPKPKTIPPRQPWEYFLVLDVEATCVAGTDFTWPNEIIEFPVVLLTWEDRDEEGRATKLKVVDEFRSFVRPTWKPKLTDFCTSLTGISQKEVDSAPTFPGVLAAVEEFLVRNGLICPKTSKRLVKFAWATDGPFDIRDFVVKQLFISKMKMPEWLQGDVVDVRKQVHRWLDAIRNAPPKKFSLRSPPRALNISRQLDVLSLSPFEGRQHSGIDDSRNIARILTELARRGVKIEPNLQISPNRRWYWMDDELGEVIEEYFPKSVRL